jgi:hypothetical protein
MMEIGSMSDGPPGPLGVVWSVKTDHDPDWESLVPYIGIPVRTPMPKAISSSVFQVQNQMDKGHCHGEVQTAAIAMAATVKSAVPSGRMHP